MPRYSGIIPADMCRKLFSYDPETGKIYRSYQVRGRFAGYECGCRRWDYSYVVYKGVRILSHRLAWAIYYGEWPPIGLDHINNDKHDNRISNLRLATDQQNNRNKPKQSNNTSGFKGVSLNKRSGRYQARITAGGEKHYLGMFATAEEAFEAYCSAALALHGEYARVSETVGAVDLSTLTEGSSR